MCRHRKILAPEGTYLLWMDCRELAVEPEKVDSFMLERAKVWMDDGAMFGPEGAGFERMNLGSPWQVLEKACGQIVRAAKELPERPF